MGAHRVRDGVEGTEHEHAVAGPALCEGRGQGLPDTRVGGDPVRVHRQSRRQRLAFQAARAIDSMKATVEPLPLVPATTTTCAAGRPSRSRFATSATRSSPIAICCGWVRSW